MIIIWTILGCWFAYTVLSGVVTTNDRHGRRRSRYHKTVRHATVGHRLGLGDGKCFEIKTSWVNNHLINTTQRHLSFPCRVTLTAVDKCWVLNDWRWRNIVRQRCRRPGIPDWRNRYYWHKPLLDRFWCLEKKLKNWLLSFNYKFSKSVPVRLTNAAQSVSSSAGAGYVSAKGKTFRIRQTSSDVTAQGSTSSIIADNRFK